MIEAVIVLLVLLGALLTVCITAALKYIQLHRIQLAVENAWYPPGVCTGREQTPDCRLHASNTLPPPPVAVLTPEFNRRLARRMADYVSRVELVEGHRITAPPMHKQVALFAPRVGPAFGVAWTYKDDCLVVAFRCTITHREIQDDLTAWQVNYDTGEASREPLAPNDEDIVGREPLVHSGFYSVFLRYRDEVLDAVERHKPRVVLVCGHSLGGAVATLVSLYVAEKVRTAQVACYVFGTPRVGNARFDIRLRSAERLVSMWRVVNRADIIQDLPMNVTPNLRYPKERPFYYVPAGPAYEYYSNWGSWRTNHFMPNYVHHVS